MDHPSPPVKTYSGGRLHEEPRSFCWQGRWRRVREVARRWRSPEGLHFTVLDEEGGLFELFYDRQTDAWQVSASGGKISPA